VRFPVRKLDKYNFSGKIETKKDIYFKTEPKEDIKKSSIIRNRVNNFSSTNIFET